MVLHGVSEPLSFYPVSLTQVSTRGIVHNLTPIAEIKRTPTPEGLEEDVPIIRIYFDGLIAHLQRPGKFDATVKELGPLVVGNEEKITISTVTFERSRLRDDVLLHTAEAHRDWPVRMERLLDLDRILGAKGG
jgi:hypothetical protein